MSEVKVKIVLTRAPDDPKVNERSFQEELGSFGAASVPPVLSTRSGTWLSTRLMHSAFSPLNFRCFLARPSQRWPASAAHGFKRGMGARCGLRLAMWRPRAEASTKLGVCCNRRPIFLGLRARTMIHPDLFLTMTRVRAVR
jgi:hypothetical protein